MTPSGPGASREGAPSPSAVLLVFIVYVAGMTCGWGFLSWWGLLLVLGAAFLAFWFHARPKWRGPAPEALLLGIFIGFVAANCWLQPGPNENRIEGPNLSLLQRFAAQHLTAPGVAMNVLAAAALLLAVSYLSPCASGLLRRRFAALILIAVALRVLILFSTPLPTMDVFVGQTEGGQGLIEGKRYRVTGVLPAPRHSSVEVARYAASVERHSKEQLAGGIVGYALRQRIELHDSVNFAAIPAKCDRAVVAGKEVLVGRPDELMQEGVDLSAFISEAEQRKVGAEELILVAADKELLGAIYLKETFNVYEMTFASPYEDDAWFYNYPYPPAVVYCNCVSWLLFKDVRGVWIVCDLLAAWLMVLLARRSNPGEKGARLGELLALTFLFLPRSLFIIEQSWTEPLVVVSMAAFALAAASGRGQALTGCLLGLWLGSKQYVLLAVPPVLKWLRLRVRTWLYAVGLGLALALPFILWNLDALMHDLVYFLLLSGGRPDALSLYGLAVAAGISLPPEETRVVVACLWVAGIAWFTWKMPRNLAGMLFATASLWIFFFVLGKQAFINYFYMIAFTLLLAVAASPEASVES